MAKLELPAAQVFWLFGLSGAGKTTLGRALADLLRASGVPVLSLDGDRLRQGLCRGLGFSTADRTENLRRAAETARLATESGLCVVATFITPLESQRAMVRGIVGTQRLILIHVRAPLEICQQRDVKGLYAAARDGQLAQLTGVGDPFEAPADVDLIVDTGEDAPALSASRLGGFALARLKR